MLNVIEITAEYINCYQPQLTRFRSCALLTEQSISFSEQAEQQLKLQPTNCFEHYWQQLDQQVISVPYHAVKSLADIAYFQLKQQIAPLIGEAEVCVVVPNAYHQAQLALALGLFQAANIKVVAMLPQALWYVMAYQKPCDLVLSLQLQSADVQKLTRASQGLVTRSAFEIRDSGWQSLIKYLSQWINQLFISQFRRDLYLTAQSEQALYQFVRHMTLQVAEQYQFDYEQQQLKITASELKQQLNKFFMPLLSRLPSDLSHILIDARLAQLLTQAGISHYLTISENQIEQQAYAKLSAWIEQLKNEHGELSGIWLSALPEPYLAETKLSSTKVSEPLFVSHLLYQHRARPIPEQGWYFNKQEALALIKTGNDLFGVIPKDGKLWLEIYKPGSVRVNGMLVEQSQILHVGDHLVFEDAPDQQFDLIYVEDTGIR